MKIDLKELQQIISLLLLDLKRKQGNEIELTSDFYWDIASDEIYNPYEEPKNISLGQLTDDWETMKSSAQTERLIAYDLQRVSNILKALSIENPI